MTRTKKIEWWEMLEWDNMKLTWNQLPEETRDKIRKAGMAPKFDSSEEKENV